MLSDRVPPDWCAGGTSQFSAGGPRLQTGGLERDTRVVMRAPDIEIPVPGPRILSSPRPVLAAIESRFLPAVKLSPRPGSCARADPRTRPARCAGTDESESAIAHRHRH